MIGRLFYLCPNCSGEDCIAEHKRFLYCEQCHSSFPFFENQIRYNGEEFSLSEFYAFIRKNLVLFPDSGDPSCRFSKNAVLRQGLEKLRFYSSEGIQSTIEKPVAVDKGHFQINQDALIFEGEKKRWVFLKNQIQSYTTNSKYLEFKIRANPFFQIFFEQESPLKYEDLLTLWYQKTSPEKPFLEHQPKICRNLPVPPRLVLPAGKIKNSTSLEKFNLIWFLLHVFIGLPLMNFFKWRAGLTYAGHQLIPRNGPFILIMNHQSYIDPILIATLAKRRIAFFTKSTSFADRLLQPVFRAYRSIPNRRYETDPIVVRQAIRLLGQGSCIGIFPEGERTWDGKSLPVKLSTIRFLLSVQVPLVIVRIQGAYDLLPRWTNRLRHGTIRIDVASSFSLLPGKWNVKTLKSMIESYYNDELS